jgi:hypothetical protein
VFTQAFVLCSLQKLRLFVRCWQVITDDLPGLWDPGTTSFSLSHAYVCDNPNNTFDVSLIVPVSGFQSRFSSTHSSPEPSVGHAVKEKVPKEAPVVLSK